MMPAARLCDSPGAAEPAQARFAPSVVAMTESRVLARTLAALGGKATAEEIARCLGLQPMKVLRRLRTGAACAEKPGEWTYFAHPEGTDGRWGLTPAGVGFAHQELAQMTTTLFAGGTQPPAQSPQSSPEVKCPECGQTRTVRPEYAVRLAQQRARNKPMPMCRSCAKMWAKRKRLYPPGASPRPASAVPAGDPALPTRTQPGSPERIAVYEARVTLKLPIFVEGDLGHLTGASRLAAMLEADEHATEKTGEVEAKEEEAETEAAA